jgi:catalase
MVLFLQSALWAAPQASKDISQEIYDTMMQVPGAGPGNRPVHAKGITCEGIFTATPAAATHSRAAHFQGKPVPVTIRFSGSAPAPSIPDNSPKASPRGIAIRLMLPGGECTDIVAISHNGFIVGPGEEFLALEKAVVASDSSQPHPWAIKQFPGTHPRAEICARPEAHARRLRHSGVLFQQCLRLREQERCETSGPLSDYSHRRLAT